MERLTHHMGNLHVPTKLNYDIILDMSEEQAEYLEEIIKKLAEYEDAEEQGLLLRLPCNVGDTVWIIVCNKIFSVKAKNKFCMICGEIHILCECSRYSDYVAYSDLNKTVFLTREEAEQALAEMKGV